MSDMDPCLVGLITASAGFTLYKILPEVYAWLKKILGEFFYKTVIVTIAQNKPKVVNLVKFMTQFPQYQNTKCINITIDGQEHNVPLIDVKFTVSGNNDYEFSMKANTDSIGNLVNVVVSTWKRNMLSENTVCLQTFDTFLKTFPSIQPQPQPQPQQPPQVQPQPPKQSTQKDKPPFRLENGKVILTAPLKSTPSVYLPRKPTNSTLGSAEIPKIAKPVLGPPPSRNGSDKKQNQPFVDLTCLARPLSKPAIDLTILARPDGPISRRRPTIALSNPREATQKEGY